MTDPLDQVRLLGPIPHGGIVLVTGDLAASLAATKGGLADVVAELQRAAGHDDWTLVTCPTGGGVEVWDANTSAPDVRARLGLGAEPEPAMELPQPGGPICPDHQVLLERPKGDHLWHCPYPDCTHTEAYSA